jgi:hypothetical protein
VCRAHVICPFHKYVLAQCWSDVNLGWVADLRTELVTDTLKYKMFRESRPRPRAKRGPGLSSKRDRPGDHRRLGSGAGGDSRAGETRIRPKGQPFLSNEENRARRMPRE